MNVLLLSRYDRLGASSRIRSYQYLPYLEKNGINTTVCPLLDNKYIRNLYSGRRKNIIRILSSYVERITTIINCGNFDAVWVEKEFFPWLPAFAPQLLQLQGISYLADYDDAFFHRYDNHPYWPVRQLLGTKIDSVMKNADIVTVGNEYLAQRANQAGATRIERVPTVVDLDRYEVRSHSNNDPFTVGWIGSPSTAEYLQLAQPALAELLSGDDRFIVVGADDVELESVPVETRVWSEETEVSDIRTFDVGIMPLPDRPWERGKCGYKLIQYMACGIPVVASPVGINQDIVEEGVNGYLVDSQSEWDDAINNLRDSPNLREKMGKNGRKKVEEEYCLEVTAPKICSLLEDICE